MEKPKRNGNKRSGGILKLKIVVEKLQQSLLLGKKSSKCSRDGDRDRDRDRDRDGDVDVPEDVKAGHFAVIAMNDNELKRFVVPLSYLTHPTFLRLLEKAAEEYGFDREGALTIPCRPIELQKILSSSSSSSDSVERVDSTIGLAAAADWNPRTTTKTMVQTF